ncbi:MAG TPA: head GIN domain-containing protein [Allosphingosinicella sp.]|uniref:head GIN domain-containing protein n=1 Tax=Allosphingosinicella sp. TaxID=2823234 RepID=UPI002ED77A90
MRSFYILASTLALAACNMAADAQDGDGGGSGRTTQQTYNVGAFEGVALAGSQNVVVTVGGAPSVRAEGDAEMIERMDIRVENGTLRIGTKKGEQWSIGWGRDRKPVTVYVTTPRLASAAVAGSGDMMIDKVEGERFAGSIAGSGDMQIGALRVNEADFSVAGSGDVRAAGSAGRLKASIAGSGDIDLAGVSSRQAQVSIVGSGDVRAQATETADVSVMGSGNVTMAGSARCSVNKRGSGDVRCGA